MSLYFDLSVSTLSGENYYLFICPCANDCLVITPDANGGLYVASEWLKLNWVDYPVIP